MVGYFLNKPEVFSRNEKFENVRAVPENNKQNSPGTVKISDLLLWRRSKTVPGSFRSCRLQLFEIKLVEK
jgi:hypothetical protein